MARRVAPAGESGADRTTGRPSSPPSRRRTSIGIEPSTGTVAPTVRVSASATVWPPPVPKTSIISSQCGQGMPDMFSITPTIFWWVCTAMVPARSATSAAAICGVVTIRISALGTSWATEMAMSPVPGGRSSSRTSRSPQ